MLAGIAAGGTDSPDRWSKWARAPPSSLSHARTRLCVAEEPPVNMHEAKGIDMTTGRRNRTAGDAQWLADHEMELARSASHIASMLHKESMQAAVREILLKFEAAHGCEESKIFTHALARKLEERGNLRAVEMLREFVKRGQSPGATL